MLTRKVTWSTDVESSKYITDEMLAPFVKDFLPTSQVELTLSCRNLINADVITKSDPYCTVSMREPWSEQWSEISKTEIIRDSLNPQWVKKFILNYNFETIQKIKFEVRDEDLQGYDYLGRFETTLGELVSFAGQQFIGKLIRTTSNRDCGEIIIVTEEVSTCKQIAEIQFRAENLTKLSMLTSNDPFLVISRSNEDGSYSVVTKTTVVKSTQNPTWNPFTIRATTLCNGDFDRNIKIDCYDHRSNGNHKLIGTCYTNLRSLATAPSDQSPMILVNEKKRKSNPSHIADGVLEVANIKITEDISFLDYIRNGTQLHFAVAIDFTASNGVYTDPKSLHHLYPGRPNCYEIALRGVGEIIEQYDSEHMFPAFGFGAKIPPSGQISHQFPLNGNPSHPYCSGVEDILHHYRTQVKSIQFYGPTNFAPVINNTSSIAAQFQLLARHYFVLLIITDGIISDMHQTKRAIINASNLPISIIIVGVGDANFENMNELDSDEVRLTVDGRYAERDIVQFVPLNKFLSNSGLPHMVHLKSQADLAKEVLLEVPGQLTSYMKSHGHRPQTLDLQPDARVIVPTAPEI